MDSKTEYLSDEAAYAMEGSVENACGLIGFVRETWAVTDGGGGTQRDSWLESSSTVKLDELLSSPIKQIDGDYYLVCVKDGIAYVREGEKGKRPLYHLSKNGRIDCGDVYATYGAAVYRVIKPLFE